MELLSNITNGSANAVPNPPIADWYFVAIAVALVLIIIQAVVLIKTLIAFNKNKKQTITSGFVPFAIATFFTQTQINYLLTLLVLINGFLFFAIRHIKKIAQ